jgi:hypothetical protein
VKEGGGSRRVAGLWGRIIGAERRAERENQARRGAGDGADCRSVTGAVVSEH